MTDNDIANFVGNVNALCKGLAMNHFLKEKLKRVNNSKIFFPEKNSRSTEKDGNYR